MTDTAAPTETGDRAAEDGPRTYYLIDGSGFIFRAFHTIPTRDLVDGVQTNAVYGFCNMLMRMLADIDAKHLAVVFDASSTTFRNDLYDQYKANRDEPPEELRPQFALIRQATAAFGLPQIEVEGYEADDIIATYCRQARARGDKAIIVSSDKDLMQLVGDGVTMLDPLKNRTIDIAEVEEKFGVGPDRVVDVQALAGDSIDNVPGVPGIGIKTAAQLIQEYGDLDALLDRAGEIKQPKRRQNLIDHADMARLSRDLVRLADNVELGLRLHELRVPAPDPERLIDFLEAWRFPSLVGRVRAKLAADHPLVVDHVDPVKHNSDYALVQDEAALQAWIDAAVEAGVVAVDTETTSLDAAQARLVGVSLATAPGKACYIPVGHTGPDGGESLDLDGGGVPPQIPLDRALALLKPLLEDPSVLKVGQNLKYDWHVLARHGIRVTPIDDTMLLSYVVDGGATSHGMDALAARYLDHQTIKYAEVAGSGKSAVTFDRVPLDKALDYAAEDADITLRLHALLKPRVVRERMMTVYETTERPLVDVIGAMELAGIKVDRGQLKAMSDDFARRIAALETEIHELAGHPFTIGSPKQLAAVLFEEMGLEGGKKGKSGTYSTDSSVLEPLAAQGHTIVEKVLDWRQLSKLKSTYTDALQDQINPQTGRVHTSFSLAATNTGRLASNDPNLQNIPIRTEAGRQIRYAFVAEPGTRLISVDYSQIELRLVAEIAGIAALQQAFREGADIHAMTASQVFGVPQDEMTGEIRRRAKAINFGIIYGISAFGLANQLRIPQSEASAFIKQYLERFHELKAWMDATKAFCRQNGYVSTLFGRKCHIPGIREPKPAHRAFAERQAINAPIQGTAADIIKIAMIRIPRALEQAGLAARMLLQVHDELLFEAPEAEAEATAALVKHTMEVVAPNLSVPLVAEAGIGPNWAEAH